ncbi:MAG: tetratricopeptide repeat protein [Alphaproteobacteria bacterium]|nr:tetratricopeptide repeat protein [Alphaproteobacteria bacterium]
MQCKSGYVVKTIKVKGKKPYKTCVKATAGVIPDNELYAQGYLLAKTGEYDWALQAFGAMTNTQTPETLTMIGYSNRKAGRLEVAVSYYDQALALKPDYVKAREYLGEGYVAAGRIDLARLQLAEIAKRVGTNSVEYSDLAKVISGQVTNL